jgi:putative Mn2+ efflux pump MntP
MRIFAPSKASLLYQMSLFDIILLAVALAMDCFTVSIVSGVIMGRNMWRTILQMSFFFGLFQAAMPFAGWLATAHFVQYIETFGHWVAFLMLAFIGGKMIWESFRPSEHHAFNPHSLTTQLLLAVATSIDAMAVGISFSFTGYEKVSDLWVPLTWIGVVSLLFGVAGHLLGVRFGHIAEGYVKPELIGGVILFCIGVKILVS